MPLDFKKYYFFTLKIGNQKVLFVLADPVASTKLISLNLNNTKIICRISTLWCRIHCPKWVGEYSD